MFALLGWVIYVQLRREMRADFESELAAGLAKQQSSLQFTMADQDEYLVSKLNGYLEWVKSDKDVVGLAPWVR